MAYNRKNYLKRVLTIQEIALHYRAQGLFFKEIYHLYVEKQYGISKRTFDNYMGINARKELKELENGKDNNQDQSCSTGSAVQKIQRNKI